MLPSVDFAPLQTSRLTDQVYEAISERIMSGALRPGDRLDVNRLAEQLRVSPTPVKNALSLLANEGLVQIVPRSGTFVTSISRTELEQALPIRLALELLAAETSVTQATDADIAELSDRVGAIAHAPDVSMHYRRNAEFHQRLVELSGNGMLAALYRQLHAHIHFALIHSQSTAWKGRAALEEREHRAIVAALVDRDLERLKGAITLHLQRSRKSMFEEIQNLEDK